MASSDKTPRRPRLHQCPGCFGYAMFDKQDADYYECDCGERLTNVDLRAAVLNSEERRG